MLSIENGGGLWYNFHSGGQEDESYKNTVFFIYDRFGILFDRM